MNFEHQQKSDFIRQYVENIVYNHIDNERCGRKSSLCMFLSQAITNYIYLNCLMNEYQF